MLMEEQEQMHRERTGQRPVPPGTQFLIGIEGSERGEPYGSIFQARMKQRIPFYGVQELIFQVAAIDRQMREPMAGEELPGSWRRAGKEESFPFRKAGKAGHPERRSREAFQAEFEGRRIQEMLSLQILGRQNASLQGWIRGKTTGGKMVFFRSVLELMILLSKRERKISENENDSWEGIRQLQIQE